MVHREGLGDLFPGDLVTVVNPYKELRAVPGTPGPLMLLLLLLLLPFLHSVQGAGTAVFLRLGISFPISYLLGMVGAPVP